MFSVMTCTPCTFQKKRVEYFNGLMDSHGFVCLGWVPRVIGRSICMEFPLPYVDHPLSSSANFFCLIFIFCSIKNLSTKFLIKNCSIAESDPKQSAYNIKSLLVAAPIQFGGPGGERILKRRLGSWTRGGVLTTYLTQCANPRKDFWHIRGIIGRGESGMRGESGSRLGAGEPLCTLWPLLGLSTPLGGCRGGCCGSQHPSTLPGGFLPLSPQSLLSKQSHLSPVTPHQSQKLWIQKLTNHTAKCILHICLWARPPNMIIQILTPSLEGFPADISIKWLVGHTKQRMHWFDHPEVHKDNFFAVTANCRDSLPRPPSPSTITHRKFPA